MPLIEKFPEEKVNIISILFAIEKEYKKFSVCNDYHNKINSLKNIMINFFAVDMYDKYYPFSNKMIPSDLILQINKYRETFTFLNSYRKFLDNKPTEYYNYIKYINCKKKLLNHRLFQFNHVKDCKCKQMPFLVKKLKIYLETC